MIPHRSIFTYQALALLAGLVLPVLLIPIVRLTGFSEIVEEFAKALIVFFLILKLPAGRMRIMMGATFGLLFGLSESMLYLNNIFLLGDPRILWLRMALTVPMHIATVLCMTGFGSFGKRYFVFGILGAVMLHLAYNLFAAGFFL